MRIIKDYPPNIEKIRVVFKLRPTLVFTYGYKIYNPSGGFIDKPLLKHEETHTLQQAAGIEEWWDKYLQDPEFRLSQELEAYRNQYREAKKYIFNKNKLFNFLKLIALDFSSEMYGNIIDFSSAMKVIKNEE